MRSAPGSAAVRLLARQAAGGVYASDAFFPFADEAGLAMVFTGERHFRH